MVLKQKNVFVQVGVWGNNLQEKAGADFAQIRLLFVVFFFQISKELPLKQVNISNVAEDNLQLLLGEHVRVFPALTDVSLKHTSLSQNLPAGGGVEQSFTF